MPINPLAAAKSRCCIHERGATPAGRSFKATSKVAGPLSYLSCWIILVFKVSLEDVANNSGSSGPYPPGYPAVIAVPVGKGGKCVISDGLGSPTKIRGPGPYAIGDLDLKRRCVGRQAQRIKAG